MYEGNNWIAGRSFALLIMVASICSEIFGTETCHWKTLGQGQPIQYRSFTGQVDFGGFWEHIKTTPEGEMARIYHRIEASGYLHKSHIQVTCRNLYEESIVSGSWTYDPDSGEFDNQMRKTGIMYRTNDACGEAGSAEINVIVGPSGTVLNATLQFVQKRFGNLAPAGSLSPSWGPTNSPEDTEIYFTHKDCAYLAGLLNGADVEVGQQRSSWLNVINLDNKFADNPGKPVRGTISGQAVEFVAMIPLPCPMTIEVEVQLRVTDREGNKHFETRYERFNHQQPNSAGYIYYQGTLPLEEGKIYELNRLRYREIPDGQTARSRLSSIDWALDLGGCTVANRHFGTLRLLHEQVPARVSTGLFHYLSTDAPGIVVQYSDPEQKELRGILTPVEWVQLELETVDVDAHDGSIVWIRRYERTEIDWPASVAGKSIILKAEAEPFEQWRHHLLPDLDGFAQFEISVWGTGNTAGEPLFREVFRHDAIAAHWQLQRSDAPFVENMIQETSGNGRRVERRWRTTTNGDRVDTEAFHYEMRAAESGSLEVLIRHERGLNSNSSTGETLQQMVDTWEYHEAEELQASVRLHQRHDGYWHRFGYDAQRRLVTVESPFGNASPTASGLDDVVIRRYLYHGEETLEPHGWLLTQNGQFLAGSLFGGSRVTDPVIGQVIGMERTRHYLTPPETGAMQWSGGDFLSSTTGFYRYGPFAGLMAMQTDVDGLVQYFTYRYTRNFTLDIPVLEVTVQSGIVVADEFFPHLEAIEHWTAAGECVLQEERDLETGIVISREWVAAIDARLRPLERRRLNGTWQRFDYTGNRDYQVTDSQGETRSYEFNPAGDIIGEVENGIRHLKMEMLGSLPGRAEPVRLLQLYQVAETGEQRWYESRYYDSAGRVIRMEYPNGDWQELEYGECSEGGAWQQRRYANGETEWQYWQRDGKLSAQMGGRLPALRYEYAVVADEDTEGRFAVMKVRAEQLERNVTGEWESVGVWSDAYFDAAGRLLAREFPNPAVDSGTDREVTLHAPLTSVQVDADGVAVIEQSDITGRIRWFGTDLDGNRRLDESGPDEFHRQTIRYLLDSDKGAVRRTVVEQISDAGWVMVSTHDQFLEGRRETLQTDEGTWIRVELGAASNGVPYAVEYYNPDGAIIRKTYSNGKCIHIVNTNLAGFVIGEWHYLLNDFNEIISELDAVGARIEYGYHADGRLSGIRQQNPASGNGSMLTEYLYTVDGDSGYLLEQREEGRLSAFTRYNAAGKIEATWGYGRVDHAVRYDGQLRPVAIHVGPGVATAQSVPLLPVQTDWQYDQRGRLSQVWRMGAPAPVRFQYSPGGRLLGLQRARTGADGQSPVGIEFSYHDDGRGIVINSRVTQVRFINDPFGEQTIVTSYDRMGRPVSIEDSMGMRAFTYGDHGSSEVSYTAGPFAGWQQKYVHDATGRLANYKLSDVAKVRHFTEYRWQDDKGSPSPLLARVLSPDGQWHYGYESGTGRLSSVSRFSGQGKDWFQARRYHGFGQLATFSQASHGEQELQRSYDSGGRLSHATIDGRTYWDYTYNERGFLAAAQQFFADGIPVPGKLLNYDYDENFHIVGLGVEAHGQTMLRDHFGRVLTYTMRERIPVWGEVNALAGTVVDVAGETAELVRDQFFGSFNADPDNVFAADMPWMREIMVRVQLATEAGLASDSYQFEHISAGNPETFQYDADGNLIEDGLWHYQWNANNQLVGMVRKSALVDIGAPALAIRFEYDAEGRRWRKQVQTQYGNDNLVQTIENRFLYQGELLSAQWDNDELRHLYTWGQDLSGKIGDAGGREGLLAVRDKGTGDVYLPWTDGLGNVMGYTSVLHGHPVAQFDYEPFGGVLRATGRMASHLPIAYSSKYRDVETGLLYFGHRYYQPRTASWLNVDPYAESGGIGLLRYVENDPVNAFDPDGRLTFLWGGNWGGPGRVNGQTGKWRERERFPREGEEGFVAPKDPEDWCYYGHDLCLNLIHCGYNGIFTNQDFMRAERGCDFSLSNCLVKVDSGNVVRAAFTAGLFRVVIGPVRVAEGRKTQRRVKGPDRVVARNTTDKPCECDSAKHFAD